MRQIGFIAAQDGAVVKYDPKQHAPAPKPKPLTRHQRATLYFKAVRYIEKLFREVGFVPITQYSHGSFTVELGNFILDMTVRESNSMPIAHVTSYVDYEFDPNVIKAKVTRMGVGAAGEYIIQVGAMLPNMRTTLPVFVVVDKNSTDPMREAFMSALTAARDLIRKDPDTLAKIQAAMAKRNIEKDFERFRNDDPEKQFPG